MMKIFKGVNVDKELIMAIITMRILKAETALIKKIIRFFNRRMKSF